LPSLVKVGDSTAEWADDPVVQGEFCAKLYTAGLGSDYAAVEITPPSGITLDDLSEITGWSFDYLMKTTDDQYYGPILELHFSSTTGDGHVDITVNTAESSPTVDGNWHTVSVTSASTATCYGNLDDGTEFGDAFAPGEDWAPSTGENNLATIESIICAYDGVEATWELTRVQVQIGWYYGAGTTTAYIDDVLIEGVTEDFEPRIKTDYTYYKMDDAVKVTVFDIGLNTRPTIRDSGTFIAASDYPDQITVDLLETGPDTCIFEGTFTVVEEEPGANDLLVEHGSTITVSYTRGGEISAISDTATVDAEAPTVTIISPDEDENITDTTPIISATVSAETGDSGFDIAWLSLDGVVRSTINNYDTLSYTPLPVEALEQGDHEVSVTASDIAGNIKTTTWTFTVDTMDPTAPENLAAELLAHSIVLSWDASEDLGTGVDFYNIYRNDTSEVLGTVDYPTTTFTDDGELATGVYEYIVEAVDFVGNAANSTALTVEFVASDVEEFSIELSEGWNLVSLPLIPENSSIEAVLSGVIENVSSVWAYDATSGEWLMYNPAIPEISDLATMEDGVGYWINMTSAATLTIQGSEFPAPPATPPVYHVVEGWNLIGYKETAAMSASEYLAGVDYVRLWTFVDGRWSSVSAADDMVPGQGYWIAVSEEGWIYP